MRQNENDEIPSLRTLVLLARMASVKSWGTKARVKKVNGRKEKVGERRDNAFWKVLLWRGEKKSLTTERSRFHNRSSLSKDGAYQSTSVSKRDARAQRAWRGWGEKQGGEPQKWHGLCGEDPGCSAQRDWSSGWGLDEMSNCSTITNWRDRREEQPPLPPKCIDVAEGRRGHPLDRCLLSQRSMKQSHQLREWSLWGLKKRYEIVLSESKNTNYQWGFLAVVSPLETSGCVYVEF